MRFLRLTNQIPYTINETYPPILVHLYYVFWMYYNLFQLGENIGYQTAKKN